MREWRRRRTIICAQLGGNGNLKDAFEKELNGFRCKKRFWCKNNVSSV